MQGDELMQNGDIMMNNNGDEDEYEDDAYLDGLPPGFKFKPEDYELIVYYLRRKIDNQPLPPNKINKVHLYKYNPQTLTKNSKASGENEWYFFTPRDRKYKNGQRPNRAAGDGYWKTTAADKTIKHNGEEVGFKRTLVFYIGKSPGGEKTNWIMHEYIVNDPPISHRGENDMRLDDWVLCRIHNTLRKRIHIVNGKRKDVDVQNEQPNLHAGMVPGESFMHVPVGMVPGETFMPESTQIGSGFQGNGGFYPCDNDLIYKDHQNGFRQVPHSIMPVGIAPGESFMPMPVGMVPGESFMPESTQIGSGLQGNGGFYPHDTYPIYKELQNGFTEVPHQSQTLSIDPRRAMIQAGFNYENPNHYSLGSNIRREMMNQYPFSSYGPNFGSDLLSESDLECDKQLLENMEEDHLRKLSEASPSRHW